MKVERKFDAHISKTLNTITQVLIELQINNFLEEVTSSSPLSSDKEEVAA